MSATIDAQLCVSGTEWVKKHGKSFQWIFKKCLVHFIDVYDSYNHCVTVFFAMCTFLYRCFFVRVQMFFVRVPYVGLYLPAIVAENCFLVI